MSKKIRVALVTSAMRCGGVESFILTMGPQLACAGFDVEVVTTESRGEWFGRVEQAGLRAIHIAGFSPLTHARRVGRRLAEAGYDVILINHAKHAQASIGMLPDNTIVIPVLHNYMESVFRIGCGASQAWNVAVGVGPQIVEFARKVAPGKQIVHIPSGPPMPSEAAFSQRRQFDTPLRIASVGRVEHSQKGVLFLPEIMKGCLDAGADVRLTVAGDGPDRDALQQRVDDLGLSDRIVLSGRLSEEKVYDLLLDSHVLLMPSFFEGWPLALQEAMACGCVPVASLLKGATDYTVIDGRTGFLAEVGQVKEFVSAIVKLHEDPSKWLELSTAAHETILTGYSDVYMTASYCRLISEALEGRYPLPRPRSSQPQVNMGLYTKGDYVPAWSRDTLRSIRLGLQKLLPGSRRHFQEDKSDLTPDDCSLCGR